MAIQLFGPQAIGSGYGAGYTTGIVSTFSQAGISGFTEFTVCGFFNATGTPNNPTPNPVLFEFSQANSGTGRLGVNMTTGGVLQVITGTGPSVVPLSTTTTMSFGQWYFVALTMNSSSNTGTLYTKLVGSPSCTVATGNFGSLSTLLVELNIGNDHVSSSYGSGFYGLISSVKFWTKGLSQVEIEAESNQLAPVNPQNLVGYWPLDREDNLSNSANAYLPLSYVAQINNGGGYNISISNGSNSVSGVGLVGSWFVNEPIQFCYPGNITVSTNSTSVTTGIDLTGSLKAGQTIRFSTQGPTTYTIASITSSTITLTTNYTGPSITTLTGTGSPGSAGVTATNSQVYYISAVASSSLTLTSNYTGSTITNGYAVPLYPMQTGEVPLPLYVSPPRRRRSPPKLFGVSNSATSTITGNSTLTAVGSADRFVASSITGVSTLTATGTKFTDLNLSDTITVSDSTSEKVNFTAATSITGVSTLTASDIAHHVLTLSESVTVSDSATATRVELVNLSDTVTVSDSTSEKAHFTAATSINGAATLTANTVAHHVLSLSDSATVSDSITAIVVLYENLSEPSITVSDSASEKANFTANTSITGVSTLTARSTQAYFATPSDTISVSDSATPSVGIHEAPSDTVSVSDSASEKASFTAQATPTGVGTVTANTIAHHVLALSDSVSVSDSTNVVKTVHENPSDTVSVSDSFSDVYAASANASLTGVASITLNPNVAYHLTFSDTVTVSDSTTEIKTVHVPLSDTVTVSDSAAENAVYSVTDTVIGSSSVTTGSTLLSSNRVTVTGINTTVGDVVFDNHLAGESDGVTFTQGEFIQVITFQAVIGGHSGVISDAEAILMGDVEYTNHIAGHITGTNTATDSDHTRVIVDLIVDFANSPTNTTADVQFDNHIAGTSTGTAIVTGDPYLPTIHGTVTGQANLTGDAVYANHIFGVTIGSSGSTTITIANAYEIVDYVIQFFSSATTVHGADAFVTGIAAHNYNRNYAHGNAIITHYATASINGHAALTASASIMGDAIIVGDSALTGDAVAHIHPTATLDGEAFISPICDVPQHAAASLSGDSSVVANGELTKFSDAVITGHSSLVTHAILVVQAATSIQGDSFITARTITSIRGVTTGSTHTTANADLISPRLDLGGLAKGQSSVTGFVTKFNTALGGPKDTSKNYVIHQ